MRQEEPTTKIVYLRISANNNVVVVNTTLFIGVRIFYWFSNIPSVIWGSHRGQVVYLKGEKTLILAFEVIGQPFLLVPTFFMALFFHF